jgi:hypothetical protein
MFLYDSAFALELSTVLKSPGAEIANRQADRGRGPVGLAGHMHDPAYALRDQVETPASGEVYRGVTFLG